MGTLDPKGLQHSVDAMVGKDLEIKGEDTVNIASLALWVERQAFPCK
jgi:hypothetical protein